MIYVGLCVFEIIKGPLKILKLKTVLDLSNLQRSNFSPAIAKAYKQSTLNDLHYVTKKIFNEGYYMSKKTLKSFESLAIYYGFGTLTAWFEHYRKDWNKVSFINQMSAQTKHRPDVEYENTKLIAEFKDEIMLSDFATEMKDARINYLEEQNTNLSSYLKKMQTIIQQMIDRDYDSWLIELYKKMQKYEKFAGKYRSNKIMIAHLKGKFDNSKTIITEEMIQLAKKVPFNKLLKLENVGTRERCKCPFHNEKTPSFYVYPDTNRGYCHGCGRSVDTIQYLVEIKKLKFNQAVLMLLSY